MSEKSPLQWGKILFCAVLSAVIGLILIYLVVMQGDDFGTFFAMLYYGVPGYLLATPIIAFLLLILMIRQRRLAHTVLAYLISLPVAIALIGVLSLFE